MAWKIGQVYGISSLHSGLLICFAPSQLFPTPIYQVVLS